MSVNRICFLAPLILSVMFPWETRAVSRRIPSSLVALWKKSRSFPGEKNTETRRMIRQGSLHGYRAAMEDLLNGPAWDFVRVISPRRAGKRDYNFLTTSIYMEMSRLATAEHNANGIAIPEFYKEALNLLIAVTPPLRKKDKNGMQAYELAKMRKNWPMFEMLSRQGIRIKSDFELDVSRKDSLWSRNISLVPLEKTPLGTAVLAGDTEDFWTALQDLMSGPAKDLLSVIHSRTSGDGRSVFHLAAEGASLSDREEFADGMELLINFITPTTFYFSGTRQENLQKQLWIWSGAAGFMVGLPLSIIFLMKGLPEAGWITGALSAAGLMGSCRAALRPGGNQDTDRVIKWNNLN